MNPNWSILNSTVKTYPSKKNRTSQSYRQSSYAPHHPFLDDDGEPDLFDQLVSDERVKGPSQPSLAGSVDQTIQSLVHKRNTLLRNVDNVLPEDRHCVKKKPKTKKRDKENVRHRSGLFVDDEEEDPYLFDFSSEKKVRCKTSRVRSSLREQKIKSTKLKKAQELRERQQLERAQCRMSKVCSTPNKDTSISNDPRLDISYISKDSSPESNAPSNTTSIRYDNMEKSSDIFMSETWKPNIRVKLSFDGTFRDECKPLSPHLAEFSCCDQDDHKNSGSSGARSVESANSDYVTCLKVGSGDEHDEKPCCSQGLNTSAVNNLEDSCPSQHRVLGHHAGQSHPERTRSNESAAMDCTDPACENESILIAEDVDDDEIGSNAEVSESEMKIIDSEDSENDIHNLTSDVNNLRLSDAAEITSDPDHDAAHSPNESYTSDRSVRSDHFITLSVSEWSDEDGSVESIDESRNLADRSRSKPDCEPASTSLSCSEWPMPALRWSDAANESKMSCSFTSTQSSVVPCSVNGTVSGRRATRLFHSRPSSELPRLEDSSMESSASTWSTSGSPSMEVTSTVVGVMFETEPMFLGKSQKTKETVRASPQKITRVLHSEDEVVDTLKSPDASVAVLADFSDRVTEISESSQDLSDGTTSNEDTVIENVTQRAKAKTDERTYSERRLQLSAQTPLQRRIQPTLIYEEEEKESNSAIFESTRLSNGAVTNSLDDTFPVDRTVVENIAPAKEPKTPGPVGNPVTLKLDDVSPIEKVEQSSIVSTVKRRHRVAAGRRAGQHVGFFDTLAEEKENCTSEEDGATFEDTRTNASRIFRRPTDSRPQFRESSFYTTAGQLSQSRFNNSSMSAIHLETGKKWRRSFIAFKNIMNHRMSVVASEDCGRLCNQKIENLINLQNDATTIMRELEECSTPKTGSDETVVAGFEEGDTIAARFGRQEKARFSLCINVPNALCDTSGRPPRVEDVDEKSCRRAPRKTRARQIEAGDFANISRLNSTLLERCCVSTNVAREIVLKYCGQTEPVPFDACFSDRVLKNCSKIGEGVYGEVFLLTRGCKKSVIKIIPIEGDQLVNGERQKTFEEIFSELAITSHLSDLNEKGSFYTECFAQLVNRHCVYGKYPRRLITLWKEYDLSKGSENDSPSLFEEDQLYIILELDHGGEDIESFSFNNAQQTLSVFNQVAHALAVAEQAFQFEHRDLHWGNILVTRCSRKKTKFVIQNRESFVNLNGVKVTIIDYTLSRITIKKHTLFNDLAKDPDLFIAEGDFQFEVYRMMRNAVKDIWDTYAPVTNVYWLRYLLDKMVKEIKYIRSNSALHRTSLAELKQMYERISRDDHCVSAFHIANSECSYG